MAPPIALGVLVSLLGLVAAVAAPLWGAPQGASFPATEGVAGGTVATCNPPNPSPSALSIPAAEPTSSVPRGSSIGFSYQLEIVNFTPAQNGTTFSVPSVLAVFPLAPSGSLQVFLPPKSFVVTGPGWTNASWATQSKAVTTSLAFPAGGTAYLSTSKLAVMASVDYGGATVAFRWHWFVVASNGATTAGPWTVPGYGATSPHLPSIFYPAPTVTLAATSGSNATIGTNWTADLTGFVAGTSFRMVLEYPSNGTELRSTFENSSPGVASFTATQMMLSAHNWLVPGTYLIHLHDRCEAILASRSVSAVYASAATVQFSVSPLACSLVSQLSPLIDLNGTSYAGGSSTAIAPSPSALSLSARTCLGHTFTGWSATGGLDVASLTISPTSIIVSASGTLEANYA